jgi:molecular chaperone GrpE (heat shock protein)
MVFGFLTKKYFESMTASITESLTASITESLTASMTESLTTSMTASMTESLTALITESLAAPIMESMTALMTVSKIENSAAINALSERLSFQTTQISLIFEQMVKTQKRLSLQMEELYDCVSYEGPDDFDAVNPLVTAIISLRDEIGHLREYADARNDEELTGQIDLLIKISDRKLFELGVLSIERENRPFDQHMDIVTDVEYGPDIQKNVITKVLSGCYKYQGEIIKRANVIVCKGEMKHE